MSEELAILQDSHKELLQSHDELDFQHEGLKLAWKIHRVDEMLVSQKKQTPQEEQKIAVRFLREQDFPACRVLRCK